MYKGKRILAVISARGGSKGIPRKNVRLLAGKPLIAYSLETAMNSEYVDDVVLSSDDEEILEIAKIFGSNVINRPKELAEDDVPLDPVIYHALTVCEIEYEVDYDYVISMQPTSPLLSTETLDRAISEFIDSGCDTLIGVRDETHLYWTKKDSLFIPLFKDRLNRQFLDPIYKETGFFISKKSIVSEDNRIGGELYVFKMPYEESIDIDTNIDWWIIERLLKNLKIVIRTDADKKLGLGHVYRGITLANRIYDDLCFLMDASKTLGIKKVSEYNYKIVTHENDDFVKKLVDLNPDIIINDVLDTTSENIMKLKNMGFFIVNFEDLGDGSQYADLTINALYERSNPPDNSYYGHQYICLRDEFFIFPKKVIKPKVKEILIIFGGTDPNNLTLRSLKSIELLKLKNVKINIILGLGYQYTDELQDYLKKLFYEGYIITVNRDVKIVAKHISKADIAITSNGRTVYEISSLGVPCISISQNEREMRHLFSYLCHGIRNMGIQSNVTVKDIAVNIEEIIGNYELRKKMSQYMADFNLKKGTERVVRLIFEKYWEREQNEEN